MRKNDLSKNRHGLNRRQFIQTSAALAGTALLSPWALTNGQAWRRHTRLSPPFWLSSFQGVMVCSSPFIPRTDKQEVNVRPKDEDARAPPTTGRNPESMDL